MKRTVKLPIGIENFEKMRTEGFYYVDKTGLIRDLLQNMAYVNLFTRPRRFGKTLNMSMLKYFFETGTDSRLFDGLVISEEKELCDGAGTTALYGGGSSGCGRRVCHVG